MNKIPNLYGSGYCIFHNTEAQQFGKVGHTTSITKRRYTEIATWSGSAASHGIQHNVKFDLQDVYGLYKLINPVGLIQFLENAKGSFANPDDLIGVMLDNLTEAKIK